MVCCLFLAIASIGASGPLFATDLKDRQSHPQGRSEADDVPVEEKIAVFCEDMRRICRKICRLRFRDDDIGCPQSCVIRESRCVTSGCYRWSEQEYLIAERFGGDRCFQ